MKSVLYVGASLMIGASIYGFVDYKQTSHKKEFTNMYVEEKETEPVPVVAIKEEPAIVSVPGNVAKTSVPKKKSVKKDVAIDYPADEEIIPIKPISEEDLMTTGDSKKIDEATVTLTPSKEHKVKVKRKKLSTKIFSRAPMKYDVEEVTIMPAKVDTKKEKE